MEHRRYKNNSTQLHHLTKKKTKSSPIFEKNIILQGKKHKNTFKMHTRNNVMVPIIIDHFC